MARFVFLLMAVCAASCGLDWDRLDPALGQPSNTGGAATGGDGGVGGEGGQGGGMGGAGGEADPYGNGVIDAGEECDDANDQAGDLCDGCVVECDGTKDTTSLHCYRLFPEFLHWDAARAICAEWGGDLVSIASAAEHEVVNSLYGNEVGPYWTGGNDIAREGVYAWSDGEAWIFAPWDAGEPNDAGAGIQNCIDVFDATPGSKLLGDNDCADVSRFICERRPPP